MANSLPLEGLRVLDVSSFIAAPAAAVVLGDYGADVIKVEPPGEGDPHRGNTNLTSFPKSEVNYPWHLDARNKRSIALDLKHPDGRAALDRLIDTADILITNYPFPVRARLRLSYEEVAARNPRLIYASFSGYGEEGADKDQPGYDSNAYFARSGLLDAIHFEGQPPGFALPAQGDRPSAMALLSAILLALIDRGRTGNGTWVASNLLANGLWSNGVYAQAALVGSYLPNRPPRERPRSALANIYLTADDRWLQINVTNETRDWPAILEMIERPELVDDPRFAERKARHANAAALTEIFDSAIRKRPFAHWNRLLKARAIPHSRINRLQDIPEDAQAVAARAVVASDAPDMPLTLAAPFQIGHAAPRRPGPGPALGQHTDVILREAGLSENEIAALRASGAAA
ncbi:CoA transferase [Hyphomicrobium sp. CS1BSMeth3]|uniref:CaiB/BaiF CoA transferase family protein n=1 Tax=Hyphomicrobium sp. CS1BSMeth3 TaxID=1892844 RepID=UPI00092FDBC6|nr:CoA transferase [Hyphomicrobium sp. CS1BSMeth3]